MVSSAVSSPPFGFRGPARSVVHDLPGKPHAHHPLALARGHVVTFGVERRGPEAPADVGDAEPGQQAALSDFTRIGAGTAEHGRWNSRAAEHFPERLAAARVHRAGRDEGVLLFVAIEGQVGEVGRGVAAQEIEDAVPAGIGAGGEAGPGDRGLGGEGGGESGVATAIADGGQVGELAGREHRLDDGRLESVQTDDQDARRAPRRHFFPKSRAMARPAPFTSATVLCQNMTATPVTAAMAEAMGRAASGPI